MIRGTRYHHGLVLSLRVPPRQGSPLSPIPFTAITLTRLTTPTILKLPSLSLTLRSCPSGRDDRGTTIGLATKRPG